MQTVARIVSAPWFLAAGWHAGFAFFVGVGALPHMPRGEELTQLLESARGALTRLHGVLCHSLCLPIEKIIDACFLALDRKQTGQLVQEFFLG